MKKKKMPDHHAQALHALNCAIACMVSWPPGEDKLGGAVYFTALALHRMAQADPDGRAADWAERYLQESRQSASDGITRVSKEHAPKIALDQTPRIVGCVCGWRTPTGVKDSDDTYAAHIAHTTVPR